MKLLHIVFLIFVHSGANAQLLTRPDFKKSAISNEEFKLLQNYSTLLEFPHLFQEAQKFLDALDVSAGCSKQLAQLGEFKEEWAFKMFDATSKVQSGILHGTLYNLGSYDECQSIHNVPMASGEYVTGKYCSGFLNAELKGTALTLGVALCMPETCSASEISQLIQYNKDDIKINLILQENKCHSKNQDPKITSGDIALIVCFGVIAFIMAISSAYDCYLYYTHKETLHPLLLAFSVVTNGRKLFSIEKSKNPNQLGCLSGIRTISMMWVLLGHTFSIVAQVPMTNSLNMLTFYGDTWTMYIRGATVSVDTFFLLGGIVMSYVYMKSKTNQCFNIFQYYLHRYLRLTPALAALLVVHLTVLKHFGGGPLWYYMDMFAFDSCKKYWWSTLLYIQNYANNGEICLGQSWYLSVDMQLFFISPLILIPLKKWPRITLALVLLAAASTTAAAFAIAWVYKLVDMSVMTMDMIGMQDYMNKYYTQPYTRAAPWLIGIIVGYLIYHVKIVRKSFRMSKVLNVILWMCSLAVLLCCVFYDMNKNEYNRGAMSSYIAFNRPAWAIALSWIIFACVNGYGGPVNAFLSLPLFQMMARLTYSMYITHFTIILLIYYTKKELVEFTNSFMMYNYWSLFMLVFGVSVIWTLAFESPIIIIEKYLLGGGSKSTKPAADLNNEIKQNGNAHSYVKDTKSSGNDVLESIERNVNNGVTNNGYEPQGDTNMKILD